MVTYSIVHSFLALYSAQLYATLFHSLSDFSDTSHIHTHTFPHKQCLVCILILISQMGIDQSVDNFKSAGHSTVTTIALGQLWKTFNKMPIELLNGNERFVVFNISKIMPGGKHTRARAHSQTQTWPTYLLAKAMHFNIIIYVNFCRCFDLRLIVT